MMELPRYELHVYIRCSNNWENVAETALFRRCGFALVDLDGADDDEPCYLAVRPVRNREP